MYKRMKITQQAITGTKPIDWRGLVTPVRLTAIPEGWDVVNGKAIRQEETLKSNNN